MTELGRRGGENELPSQHFYSPSQYLQFRRMKAAHCVSCHTDERQKHSHVPVKCCVDLHHYNEIFREGISPPTGQAHCGQDQSFGVSVWIYFCRALLTLCSRSMHRVGSPQSSAVRWATFEIHLVDKQGQSERVRVGLNVYDCSVELCFILMCRGTVEASCCPDSEFQLFLLD